MVTYHGLCPHRLWVKSFVTIVRWSVRTQTTAYDFSISLRFSQNDDHMEMLQTMVIIIIYFSKTDKYHVEKK